MADRPIPRRELLAKLNRYEGGLARGRQKGADVQRLAAVLRQSLIDRAVTGLLDNPETAKWRTDAIVDFVFERQREIGLRQPYAFTTLDRIVRRAIGKARAHSRQSNT